MAQISVKINGFVYTVGCEDGQEEHLQAMAAEVDKRIEGLKALSGNSGEVRLLLLASLVLADEVHDLRAEIEPLRKTAAKADPAAARKADAEMGKRLAKLAARAERIAAGLEPS